jgi:hypothetical protein
VRLRVTSSDGGLRSSGEVHRWCCRGIRRIERDCESGEVLGFSGDHPNELIEVGIVGGAITAMRTDKIRRWLWTRPVHESLQNFASRHREDRDVCVTVNATSTAVVVGGRRRGTRRCAGGHAEKDEDVSSPIKTKRYDGLDRFSCGLGCCWASSVRYDLVSHFSIFFFSSLFSFSLFSMLCF